MLVLSRSRRQHGTSADAPTAAMADAPAAAIADANANSERLPSTRHVNGTAARNAARNAARDTTTDASGANEDASKPARDAARPASEPAAWNISTPTTEQGGGGYEYVLWVLYWLMCKGHYMQIQPPTAPHAGSYVQ